MTTMSADEASQQRSSPVVHLLLDVHWGLGRCRRGEGPAPLHGGGRGGRLRCLHRCGQALRQQGCRSPHGRSQAPRTALAAGIEIPGGVAAAAGRVKRLGSRWRHASFQRFRAALERGVGIQLPFADATSTKRARLAVLAAPDRSLAQRRQLSCRSCLILASADRTSRSGSGGCSTWPAPVEQPWQPWAAEGWV